MTMRNKILWSNETKIELCSLIYKINTIISHLFNQVGQLRTSYHLQLQPGQDKAKQCDKNNKRHVKRKPGTIPTVKHGGGGIML